MVVPFQGHQKEIWALAISSNGNFLVSAAHDKSIRLWEKTDEIVVLEDEKENVSCTAFVGMFMFVTAAFLQEREQEAEKALEQTEEVVSCGYLFQISCSDIF